MPIYEFYCSPCHTVFNFFSARIDTEAAPTCPRCRGLLARKPATFATLSRRGESDEIADLGGLDEERMTGVVESMMEEMERSGEADDPRQMAGLLRRVSEAAGLEPGSRLEEMLRRLEGGEDPEVLEEEMGDDLDDEATLAELFRRRRATAASRRQPRVDPELYFL